MILQELDGMSLVSCYTFPASMQVINIPHCHNPGLLDASRCCSKSPLHHSPIKMVFIDLYYDITLDLIHFLSSLRSLQQAFTFSWASKQACMFLLQKYNTSLFFSCLSFLKKLYTFLSTICHTKSLRCQLRYSFDFVLSVQVLPIYLLCSWHFV